MQLVQGWNISSALAIGGGVIWLKWLVEHASSRTSLCHEWRGRMSMEVKEWKEITLIQYKMYITAHN
eukprot:1150492-Pelagomonas_calceolata.AAC.2